MKYLIIIRGDMNDANYIEQTTVVDFNENPFQDWGVYKDNELTWNDIFNAFGESILKYEAIKSRSEIHCYNWSDEAKTAIYNLMIVKLKHILELDIDVLQELLFDFLPDTRDYPLHTILSIKAIPQIDVINYY